MTQHWYLSQMCTDIHAWLPLLDEATTWTLPSPRPTSGGAGSPDGHLPYRLSQRLDQLDDGMPGAHTPAGITTILQGWADAIAAARGEPRTTPPALYLATTAEWWGHQYSDAGSLAEDITTAWHHIAQATGHTDQADTSHRCPACGGTLIQATTDRGLSDWRTCTTCDMWYPDGIIIDATRHHTITHTTDGEHWVTRQDALNIHAGHLTPATLRQWIHRGHVATRGHLVNLTHINARIGARK